LPSVDRRARVQSRQKGLRHRRDDADLAAAVAVAPALGDLAGIVRIDDSSGSSASMARTISAADTTSSIASHSSRRRPCTR
jgi:hypothetical protein